MKRGTIERIFNYFYKSNKYRNEIRRALVVFFGDRNIKIDETAEGLFNEWLLYDFKMLNNRSFLEEYVMTNPENLIDKNLKIYKGFLDNKFGIFEVIKIQKGESLKVIDLQSGVEYIINEKTATQHLKRGNVFIGRIGRVEGCYELVGANPIFLNSTINQQFRQAVPQKTQFDPLIVWQVLNA